jgi:hypothetical protein
VLVETAIAVSNAVAVVNAIAGWFAGASNSHYQTSKDYYEQKHIPVF